MGKEVRETAVALVHSRENNARALVVSLATRNYTQVVQLQGYGGQPHHAGKWGIDVFENEAEALEHIKGDEDDELEITRGVALLGYVPIGNRALVLLATRVRTAVTLPGGHAVKLVANSKWINIPLDAVDAHGSPLTRAEQERLTMLAEYTLDNAHYFCESVDITRPFPSSSPADQPSWEFVWNNWLGASLRAAGLQSLCPPLLQGMAASRELLDLAGRKFTMALISRRSCLHPGMRYIARGLNALASPGNEAECEQLVWTSEPGDKEKVQWTNFLWRRGTVPIWWGVEMKSGGFGDVDVFIAVDNPYRGTRRYFRRLQKRYAAHKSASQQQAEQPAQQQQPADDSLQYPVTCINLLRCNMLKRNELTLSEHFAEGVRLMRRQRGGMPVQVRNFDWHASLKDFREAGTVEALWTSLQPFVPPCGMAAGSLQPGPCPSAAAGNTADSSEAAASQRPDSAWGSGSQHMHWTQQQQGLLRFNCADSLDRTNAASYFVAVQALVEQCRRLGLHVEGSGDGLASVLTPGRGRAAEGLHTRDDGVLRSPRHSKQAVNIASVLPEGWEERHDAGAGTSFYIDHNMRRTFWEDQLPAELQALVTAARQGSGSRHIHPSASAPSLQPEPTSMPTANGSHTSSGARPAATGNSRGTAGGKNGGAAGSKGLGSGPQPGYGLFGCSVEQVRQRLQADVIAEHAGFFKVNGDMNAYLYTSSRAMHSEILNLLLPQMDSLASGAMGGLSKLQNLSITLQRRWSNVLSDAQRQHIVEMFLGLRLATYFPSAQHLQQATPPLQDDTDSEEEVAAPMASRPASAAAQPAKQPETLRQVPATLIFGDVSPELVNLQTTEQPERLLAEMPASSDTAATSEAVQQDVATTEEPSQTAAAEADVLGLQETSDAATESLPSGSQSQSNSKPRLDHPLSLI